MFIKQDAEAESIMSLENDIAAAITFLRWRQENGIKNNAPLDYKDIEY